MATGIDKLASELQRIIDEKDRKKKRPYDTEATVTRVEGDIAWVKIPGGVDETPAQRTIGARPGDSVQLRVSGGRAYLIGNGTSPPTDDRVAYTAMDHADVANENASAAGMAANEALDNANIAAEKAAEATNNAAEAKEAAEQAKTQATAATTAANEAKTKATAATTAAVISMNPLLQLMRLRTRLLQQQQLQMKLKRKLLQQPQLPVKLRQPQTKLRAKRVLHMGRLMMLSQN